MALEWLSDDPHAYDWALLEGSFSAYESPPPPGVYFTYPSLRYEAVVCSSGWDKDWLSSKKTAREPGLFPDEARYQNLRKLRSDFHSQDRFLSEEEKTLDLSQLHRKWKDEAQRRAHLRRESRPTDWDDLGNLEPEMKQWTKAAIRGVIWMRKQERWLKRMRQLNIPIHTCEDCSRQVTSSHRCVPTGLAIPTIGNSPYSRKEPMVSQQGGNLALKPKDVVVPVKLRGEIEKMSTLLADKETLVAQQKHLTGTLAELTRSLNAERRLGTPQREPPLVIPKTTMTPARTNFGTSLPAAGGAHPLTQPALLRNRTPERRTSPRISSALQYLTLSQGRKEYYGLVDTGSQINLIDVDLMPTLRHDEVLPTTGRATEFRGSTGGNTPILGWAVLTFCLPTGEAVTTPYAVVSRPPAQLVLGLPFFFEGYLSHTPASRLLRSPAGTMRLTLAPTQDTIPPQGVSRESRARSRSPQSSSQPIWQPEPNGGLFVATSSLEREDSKTRRERNARNRALRRAMAKETPRSHTGSPLWSQARRAGRKRQREPGCSFLADLFQCCDPIPELRPRSTNTPTSATWVSASAPTIPYLRAEARRTPCPEPPFGPPEPAADQSRNRTRPLTREQLELEDLSKMFFAPDWEEGPPMSYTIWLSPGTAAEPSKEPVDSTRPPPSSPTPRETGDSSLASGPSARDESPELHLALDTQDLPVSARESGDGPRGTREGVPRLADSNASEKTKSVLPQLLRRYDGLWRGERRGCARSTSHRISTTSDRPIATAPRAFPPFIEPNLRRFLRTLQEAGVIEDSTSPHASEVGLTEKEDGSWEVYIDYRHVNNATVPDPYPLPHIGDLVREVRRSRYFVALTLRAGFWQIRMEPASVFYTAFRCMGSLYQFTVMPQGLRNAPATLQRMMDGLLRDLRDKGVLVHLDELLVHGATEDETLARLEEVFRRLSSAGLTLDLSKCAFFPTCWSHHGRIYKEGFLLPDPKQVLRLRAWRVPRTLVELRSLAGLFADYQVFIKDYTAIMAPLYALIRTSAASSKKISRTSGQPEFPGGRQEKDVAPFAEALTAFIERHPCGLASAPVPEDLDVATFLGEIKVSARALPGWLRRRRVVVLEDTLASGKTALARRLAPSWADEPSALAEGWLDHCGYYGWNEGDILALPPRPRQNLILALTILGLVRLRQRQPEATEIISSRSLLAIIFQWGHEDSVQVARWFLGAPPLAFYNPDTTSFIVAIFPYEGTPESSRQRKREVRERTREGYHLEDQEREYRRVRIGLERYVCWLKSVYTDVQVVTSAEERLEALKRRQLLPQETVDLISTTAARPLGNKHRPIQWTLDCTSAVQRAVHSLSEATLVIPTDEDEYFVEAGRSDLAIGATLSVNRKGRSFPVAFHSKSVIGPMEHWPIREQEAFAVVEGVRQFDSFLRGRPFTIHTSHASFKWVLQATEGRAASWAKCLTQFDMTIHHKDGATSALAQPLHLTKVQPNLESYTTPPAKDPGDTKGLDESDQLPEGLWSDESSTNKADFLSAGMTREPTLVGKDAASPIEEPWEPGQLFPAPVESTPASDCVSDPQRKTFTRHDRVSLYNGRIYIPPGHWRHKVLSACHSRCSEQHPGAKKTHSILLEAFDWPGLHQDIQEHVAACPSCDQAQPGATQHLGSHTSLPAKEPPHQVHLNHWSLPYDGTSRDVLAMVDGRTGWAEAVVVPDRSTETTASAFFRHWVCRFGAPCLVMSSKEAAFTGRSFESLVKQLGAELRFSPPAETEDLRSRLSNFLRYANQEEIPLQEALDAGLFSYRTSLHGTIRESPHSIYMEQYGLDPSLGPVVAEPRDGLPTETTERLQLLRLARMEIRNRAVQEPEWDLARKTLSSPPPDTFQSGQLVLLRTTTSDSKHPKASPRRLAPCRVVSVSRDGKTASARSLLSEDKWEVHLPDVVFVRPPSSSIRQGGRTEWSPTKSATRSLPLEDLPPPIKGSQRERSSTTPSDNRKRRAAPPIKPLKKKTSRSLV